MLLLRYALVAALMTVLLHVGVLLHSGLDGIATPISELSRQSLGALHSLALMLFATAHVALFFALKGLDRGRLWPWGRMLLVGSGGVLPYVAYYFAASDAEALRGPSANDPLWFVATLIGFAMGALQPGLSRRSGTLGVFNGVCLGIWLLLIPAILFVDASWLGAYERIVGSVYVLWLGGLAAGLMGSLKDGRLS